MKNIPTILRTIRIIPIAFLTLFCLSFATQNVAFAADGTDASASPPCNKNSDFFSSNDIEFYDRCAIPCTTGTGAVQLAGINNTEKVLKYLMDKGLNLAQASGIVGNFKIESGDSISPNIQEKSQKFPNGGWGIAQWTAGRRPTMVAAIKKAGLIRLYTPNDSHNQPRKLSASDNNALLAAELDYLWSEATGPESEALRQLKTVQNDPVKAADVWQMKFERPLHFDTARGKKASDVYNKYVDAPPLSDGTDSSSDTSTDSSTSANCAAFPAGNLTSFQKTIQEFAWPTYWQKAGRDEKKVMPAYKQRIDSVKNKGIYTGGAGNPYIDCGGFVTNTMLASGFEPNYNHAGKFSQGAGPTAVQEAWVKAHWQFLGKGTTLNTGDLRPGDVAFVNGHTWMFVGDIAGFNSKYASAALHQWAPTASFETSPSQSAMHNGDIPRWYRKK